MKPTVEIFKDKIHQYFFKFILLNPINNSNIYINSELNI